jgi:antitoxin CcdA
MPRPARKSVSKRATNVSLSADLIAEARALQVNVSEACERGLADHVQKAREAKWLEDNLPALEAWNEWVRENGIPYAEYRQF